MRLWPQTEKEDLLMMTKKRAGALDGSNRMRWSAMATVLLGLCGWTMPRGGVTTCD